MTGPEDGDAQAALAALIADFIDVVHRLPMAGELAEILEEAFQGVDQELLADLPAQVRVRVAGLDGPGPGGRPRLTARDFDDVFFDRGIRAIDASARSLQEVSGRVPSVQEVCDALAALLPVSPVESSATGVTIEAKVRRLRGRVPKRGDLVAIPVGHGHFRFALVVAKNRFGLGIGFFAGRGPLRSRPVAADASLVDLLPHGAHPPIYPRPLYTDDEMIRSGRWPIVGQSEDLLRLFPESPEIFHHQNPNIPNPSLGPYGAGETVDGVLRPLSKEEASEVGLYDGRFRQVWHHEYLEPVLDDWLSSLPGAD